MNFFHWTSFQIVKKTCPRKRTVQRLANTHDSSRTLTYHLFHIGCYFNLSKPLSNQISNTKNAEIGVLQTYWEHFNGKF